MDKVDETLVPFAISDRGPLHWALNELTIRVVEAMLKELGVSETLEVVRPRIHYSGRAMAKNFGSRFNLELGSLEAIAFPPFCARCLVWGGKGRMTFYERGITNEFFTCPMSHGPPEICLMTSHFVGEGVCEEINPDLEMIYTHHMTQGDPCCVGVCKRKNEPGINIEDLGRKLKIIEDLEMDEGERDALSFNIETHLPIIFLEAFLSIVNADKVSNLLKPSFMAIGEEAGKRMKISGGNGESLKLSTSSLLTWGEIMGQSYEVKEVRDEGYELTVTRCLYCHSPSTVCELMESFLTGVLSVLNPGASVRFKKCKDVSLETCKIIFQPKLFRPTSENDPLLALKMLFVKGEISEDEYRRKREVLLEK